MKFHTFIDKLSNYETIYLINLWKSDDNVCFTTNDIPYLKHCYIKSEIVFNFFKFYKSIPLDIQEKRYFKTIVYYYILFYQDFLYKNFKIFKLK